MYCSNKDFLDIARKTGVRDEDMYSSLQTVLVLLKKYGNLLKSLDLQKVLHTVDASLAKFIQLLSQLRKLDVASISQMLRLLQDTTNTYNFSVKIPYTQLAQEKIIPFLEEKFAGAQVDVKTSTKTELQVSGNGWYYKRSLERDLDKMLK